LRKTQNLGPILYLNLGEINVKVVGELVKTLIVAFYSSEGKTKKMAEYIVEGAKTTGVKVKLKKVEDCSNGDLVEADGIALGSPTYFSNMAWQVKKLIDETITAYEEGYSLKDKIGACFTSAGTHRDGSVCVRMLELALGFHHKMKMVPGIVNDSDDKEEELARTCKDYGKRIAEQLK
jgi:NAD(P)H dehydrogenase (quinone)